MRTYITIIRVKQAKNIMTEHIPAYVTFTFISSATVNFLLK